MSRILFLINFILIIFLSSWLNALALSSELYLSGPKLISLGQEFAISVDLSTADKINVVNAEIVYSSENLEYLGYDNSSSIVDLWQRNPKIINKGKIEFAGGLFDPFFGDDGHIVNLKFKSLKPGDAYLSISGAEVYSADGLGTPSSVTKIDHRMSISEKIVEDLDLDTVINEDLKPSKDDTYPTILTEIVKNPTDGVKLISFNAIDSESGISAVFMRSKSFLTFNEWNIVENPVLFPRGAWKVQIKAGNNQGLESVNSLYKISNLVYKVILLLLIVLILVYNVLKRKRK